ncbi:hypothetical protein K0U73_12775 [bacterium]|nr:hypothetical protein [bacterium]
MTPTGAPGDAPIACALANGGGATGANRPDGGPTPTGAPDTVRESGDTEVLGSMASTSGVARSATTGGSGNTGG